MLYETDPLSLTPIEERLQSKTLLRTQKGKVSESMMLRLYRCISLAESSDPLSVQNSQSTKEIIANVIDQLIIQLEREQKREKKFCPRWLSLLQKKSGFDSLKTVLDYS